LRERPHVVPGFRARQNGQEGHQQQVGQRVVDHAFHARYDPLQHGSGNLPRLRVETDISDHFAYLDNGAWDAAISLRIAATLSSVISGLLRVLMLYSSTPGFGSSALEKKIFFLPPPSKNGE
jgi:hypothetical protein